VFTIGLFFHLTCTSSHSTAQLRPHAYCIGSKRFISGCDSEVFHSANQVDFVNARLYCSFVAITHSLC